MTSTLLFLGLFIASCAGIMAAREDSGVQAMFCACAVVSGAVALVLFIAVWPV